MTQEIYNEITYKGALMRGRIINMTSLLEKHIEEIISRYFCGEKDIRNELINVILATDRLTFKAKLDILKYVIEKKYLEFKINNPTWFNDFVTIMEERNKFAHYVINTNEIASDEFKKGNIGFVKFKNQQIIFHYTDKMVEENTLIINDYIFKLRDLLKIK